MMAKTLYGEPVFIPRFEHADEDDGWIIALRLNLESISPNWSLLIAKHHGRTSVIIHLRRNGFHGN